MKGREGEGEGDWGRVCLPVPLARKGHGKVAFGWSSEDAEQTSYGKLWGWWAESVVCLRSFKKSQVARKERVSKERPSRR